MKDGVFGVRIDAYGKESGARHCEPRLCSLGVPAITTFKTDASTAKLVEGARSIGISVRIQPYPNLKPRTLYLVDFGTSVFRYSYNDSTDTLNVRTARTRTVSYFLPVYHRQQTHTWLMNVYSFIPLFLSQPVSYILDKVSHGGFSQ